MVTALDNYCSKIICSTQAVGIEVCSCLFDAANVLCINISCKPARVSKCLWGRVVGGQGVTLRTTCFDPIQLHHSCWHSRFHIISVYILLPAYCEFTPFCWLGVENDLNCTSLTRIRFACWPSLMTLELAEIATRLIPNSTWPQASASEATTGTPSDDCKQFLVRASRHSI